MLVLTLVMAFAAAPEPWPAAECKSAYGKTACGYDCTSGFGEVACAETPYGKCIAAYGKVRCADPNSRVRHVYHGALPQMECKAAFGDLACGYDCEAGYGQVACADAPDGKCQAALGRVTCWSPEPLGRPHDHWGEPGVDLVEPPPVAPRPPTRPRPGEQATCRSAFGTTACGYDCVAAFGTVKCAQTPLGACKAAFGEIVCFDPPRHHGRRGPKAQCESAFGKTACGYGCVAAFGDIRCAKSPNGACQAAYGEIVCSD